MGTLLKVTCSRLVDILIYSISVPSHGYSPEGAGTIGVYEQAKELNSNRAE